MQIVHMIFVTDIRFILLSETGSDKNLHRRKLPSTEKNL